jgi:DNA-binding CsgD family transcriptional regulator
MNPKLDFVRKKFDPQRERTIKNALAQRLRQDFPRLGGDRILNLCAEMILEVVEQHLRSLEHVRHGQVVWMGVSRNDPPARRKRIIHTDLVPVVLSLSTAEDIDAILARQRASQRLLGKALRLCQEAYDQGALLSNCDLAELLNKSDSHIASLLAAHERKQQQVIPRRATLHDMGSALTHKRIICWKRYAEGKSQDQIARETHHSLEAVDQYLGKFDRVRNCLQQGMNPTEIAFTLNCSLALVNQYIAIDNELNESHQGGVSKPRKKDD